MDDNELIVWLNDKRGDDSIRVFSKRLGLSHSYVNDIMNGKKPITWNFCATVAEKLGIGYLQVFQMAGLLAEHHPIKNLAQAA